jgi:hypothetical protein
LSNSVDVRSFQAVESCYRGCSMSPLRNKGGPRL